MENHTVVTIIIPVYNVEPYLEQCLDSLLNQTLNNFEVICVDDGSTDHSLLILRQYASKDSRIIVKQQEHRGAGAARNLGLQFASGEYVIFLDSDDFFESELLETLVEAIDAEHSDIAVCKARKFYNDTTEFRPFPASIRNEYCPPVSPFSPHEFPKYIFNMFQIAPWNKMFRHSFIQAHHILFQEIPRANDVAFVIEALSLAKKITVVKKELVNYRINTGTSLQQTNDKTPLSFWSAFTEAKNRLILTGHYEEYKQSFLNCVLINTFYNLRSVNTIEAHDVIVSLIKHQAEETFGFFKEPVDYYYQPALILEYCLINPDLPITLERLKEYRFNLQTKIQDQSKKIQDQSKKIQDQNKKIQDQNKKIQDQNKIIQAKNKEIQNLNRKNLNLENELKKIKGSKSFLIGETLAWPVRKTRNLLK